MHCVTGHYTIVLLSNSHWHLLNDLPQRCTRVQSVAHLQDILFPELAQDEIDARYLIFPMYEFEHDSHALCREPWNNYTQVPVHTLEFTEHLHTV
jgi:hypothetical protein